MKRQGPTKPGDRIASLPVRARLFVRAVICLGAVAVPLEQALGWGPAGDPWLVVLLAALGAAGGAFEIFAPGQYSLQPNFAFLFWAALVLPPWGIAAVALACFAPALLAGGIPLYKNLFNVANYFLTGIVISLLAATAGGLGDPRELGAAGLVAIAGGAALGALMNHALIVVAVALAGEQPVRSSLRQFVEGMPLSVGVGLTGAVLAILWQVEPSLVLVAAGPLSLTYRALWVPMLRHQATTDPKTGLLNYERFSDELEAILRDTQRHGRELAIVMVDLDHLRTINNELGHLVGDRAIRAVADALGAAAAAHGLAARFGGEEFCLLLPGFSSSAASELMEEVRLTVARVEFREGFAADLKIGFSAGVAVFPEHGTGTQELIRAADAALYDAKAAGRGRIHVAPPPQESARATGRVKTPLVPQTGRTSV